MGIFSSFNRKTEEQRKYEYLTSTFKLLQGYQPVFSSFDGGLYEMALTRSCIDKIATQCSKLNPIIDGGRNYKKIQTLLETNPNAIMTTQQFLYRLVTILLVENNAFIIPIYANKYAKEVVGFYPARTNKARVTKENGTEYLVYYVNDKAYAIEYDRVGHLRRYYYKKEYMGESNGALKSTMELINTQEQGIREGIKSGAAIRFLARLGVVQKPEDVKKEQQRLKTEQLSMENNGGVLIFDTKYADVKKVDSTPYTIDEKQMGLIKQNVFDYFHMSEEILQNTASEDQWNLFYEDVIEPIAIQIGQVLTNMIVKPADIERGRAVVLESSKLQFVSNTTKLQIAQQLFDRGILSRNQVNDIFNLPHVENGDDHYIRKEYANVNNLDKENIDEENGNSQSQEQGGESNNSEGTNNENQN